tara:strand:- start:44 stop:403 length:360 start_codon:yes stop_codon:yes gene_type:complete
MDKFQTDDELQSFLDSFEEEDALASSDAPGGGVEQEGPVVRLFVFNPNTQVEMIFHRRRACASQRNHKNEKEYINCIVSIHTVVYIRNVVIGIVHHLEDNSFLIPGETSQSCRKTRSLL